MSPKSSVPEHLWDIAVILVLGTAYVALLSVVTASRYAYKRIVAVVNSVKHVTERGDVTSESVR